MECGLGTKTIVGGTSVEYKPAIVKPSMTMLFHYGHTAFYVVGATVSSLAQAYDPQNSCFVTLDCSGQFMRLIKVKSTVLTAELVSGAVLTVGIQAAKEYDIDGIVYLQTADGLTTDDNSGAGYQIISKDTVAGTITVNADPTPIPSGSSVKPWAPAGWVMPASIPGKALDFQVDTVNEVMSTASVTITDEVEYLTDEKTPSGYPEAYTCGARAVSLAAASYMRPDSLKYFQQAEDGESYRFTIVPEASITAGQKLTVDALNTKPNVIVVDDKGITKGVSITADIDGTVGEDELSITYS
jgi:hypothetical protein